MNEYRPRKIEFKETLEIGKWSIKTYTISKGGDFSHPVFYEEIKNQLPKWLSMKNSFNSDNNKVGFLILHSGTEGIFSLINWWVGENMLNTHIFLTSPKSSGNFIKISGDGLAPCVWELDIINHERISWMEKVLKHGSNPNYQAYLEDVYNAYI